MFKRPGGRISRWQTEPCGQFRHLEVIQYSHPTECLGTHCDLSVRNTCCNDSVISKRTSKIWTWVSGWNLYISYLIKFPWSNGHSPSKLIWSEAAAYCCDSPKSNIVGKKHYSQYVKYFSWCRILFHEMPMWSDVYYVGNFWMPHLAMSVLFPFTNTDTVIIKAYIHIHIGGICCQYIYIYIVPAPPRCKVKLKRTLLLLHFGFLCNWHCGWDILSAQIIMLWLFGFTLQVIGIESSQTVSTSEMILYTHECSRMSN